LEVRSLIGKPAAPAESFNFQRTAQQCELSQARGPRKKFVHFGHLDVTDAAASNAQDVVMRLDIAVVARNIVQQRYLARLPYFAKFIENPMDGVQ
jgi:hypothetical protein